MDYFLKNYRCVKEYDQTVDIPESLIDSLLQRTWKITPSKNNFMPYKVHVIGPGRPDLKDKIFKKCLSYEATVDNFDRSERYTKYSPNFLNILTCSYLLFFTSRIEDKPNRHQRKMIDKGVIFEQTDVSNPDQVINNSILEVGMFTNSLSALCLENNLDVSYNLCFPKNLSNWSESEFNFLKFKPLLLMTIGKAKTFKEDLHRDEWDLKPDYRRIINFI